MKILQVSAGNQFFTTDAPFPENFCYYSDFVARLAKPMGGQTLDILHAAVGVSGEAGELLDAVKKNWAYGKELDLANVVEELGDLRFYMQHLMNTLGITEQDVIQHNVEKLSKRYAEGYSDKAAQARADKQEPFAAPTAVDAEQGLLRSDATSVEDLANFPFVAVPFGYKLDKNDPDWSAS